MRGASANPSMPQRSREAITGQADSMAVVHPDTGHAVYVPNQGR